MAIGTPTAIGSVAYSAAHTTNIITLSAAANVGDLVRVFGYFNASSGTPTITDNSTGGPNTWTLDANAHITSAASDFLTLYSFSTSVTHQIASSGTITVTIPSHIYSGAGAWKVTGITTSSFVDVLKSAVSTSPGSTAPATGTSSATAQASEIVWGIVGFVDYVSGTETISGPSAGYTALTEVHAGGGVDYGFFPYYQILSATGTQSFSATYGDTADWAALVITDKGISSAALTRTALSTVTPVNHTTIANGKSRAAVSTIAPTNTAATAFTRSRTAFTTVLPHIIGFTGTPVITRIFGLVRSLLTGGRTSNVTGGARSSVNTEPVGSITGTARSRLGGGSSGNVGG